MNVNALLLRFFFNRSNYVQYRQYIDVDKDEKELYALYQLLDRFWLDRNEEVVGVSPPEFQLWAQALIGDREDLLQVLKTVVETDVSEYILKEVVEEAKSRKSAMEIALIAMEVSEGRKKMEDLLTKVNSHGTILVEDEEPFVDLDLERLYAEIRDKPGLRWRLRSLNERLGSLRRGNFGFLFARPESGKTTFLASEGTHMAAQLPEDEYLLWFNNEQEGGEVGLRVIQAALGISDRQLKLDLPKYKGMFFDIFGDRIKLYDSATIHRNDVERVCRRYKPGLIIVDQLDKLGGFSADRNDLVLGSIYRWAREISKEYAPFIGVSQSDASGEGKKWLTMENVADAKTAKQAEADWILGIGKTADPGYEFVRYFHLSKNKLPGDEDTLPALRHSHWDVIIEPEIARYRDVG